MKPYRAIHELQTTGGVTAGISLRTGGVSRAPYASLNLAEHVGDDPSAVATNRGILLQQTGLKNLRYCRQVHGSCVINVDDTTGASPENLPEADALVSACRGVALGNFYRRLCPYFYS